MTTRIHYIFLCLFLCLLVGCEKKNSTEPHPDMTQRLGFTPENVTVSVGQQTTVRLFVANLTDSAFAVSTQITYADSIVSFAGVATAGSEDFFGTEAVQFVKDTLSVLHVTISRVQGQMEVCGSGTICTFQFIGKAAGDCIIEVLPEQLEFYDSEGQRIEVQELEIETAVVHIV